MDLQNRIPFESLNLPGERGKRSERPCVGLKRRFLRIRHPLLDYQIVKRGPDRLDSLHLIFDLLEAILLGEAGRPGLHSVLPLGATVIDMSSSEPMRSRTLEATPAQKGQRYVDAPVSGGVKRAVDGSLAIMVGGDADPLARCADVLKLMGKHFTQVGRAGAGHAMKALNNYVSAAGLACAASNSIILRPDFKICLIRNFLTKRRMMKKFF